MLVLKYGNFLGESSKDVERALSNYTDNVTIGLDQNDNIKLYNPTKDNLVLGQHIGNFEKLKFGDTTMYDAGCGLIATYNAMTLADYNVDFFRLAAEFEYNGLTITSVLPDGMFGSNPIAIDDCLDSYNAKYEIYNKVSIMDNSIVSGKSGIVLIAGGKINLFDLKESTAYAHYFAVTRDPSNSKDPILSINNYCDINYFTNKISIDDTLETEEIFILGLILK